VIEHAWTVVCSHSVIDVETKNVSLHNVVEQLNVPEELRTETMLGYPLEVVSLWSRAEPHTSAVGEARVVLVAPSGRELGSGSYAIDLSEHERFRSRIRLRGVPAEGPGRYVFKVYLRSEGETDWKPVAGIPLSVTITASGAKPNQQA